jgi:hypothetical protein
LECVRGIAFAFLWREYDYLEHAAISRSGVLVTRSIGGVERRILFLGAAGGAGC